MRGTHEKWKMNVSIMPNFNPFLANVPILYPLKTPENVWFSCDFRGYKMGTLARNKLHVFFPQSLEPWKELWIYPFFEI